MIRKPKGIQIRVDPSFYNNIFERERKKLEGSLKKLSGINRNLSQTDFTRIIAQNNGMIKMRGFKFEPRINSFKRKKR